MGPPSVSAARSAHTNTILRFIRVSPLSSTAPGKRRKGFKSCRKAQRLGDTRMGRSPVRLGAPTRRRPPYKFSAFTRVGFSDTDAQGIVYYGRYLPYFDQARVEYARHLQMLATRSDEHEFVMRASTIEYHAPARFDDLLEVLIRVSRIGRTSLTNEFCAVRVA